MLKRLQRIAAEAQAVFRCTVHATGGVQRAHTMHMRSSWSAGRARDNNKFTSQCVAAWAASLCLTWQRLRGLLQCGCSSLVPNRGLVQLPEAAPLCDLATAQRKVLPASRSHWTVSRQQPTSVEQAAAVPAGGLLSLVGKGP